MDPSREVINNPLQEDLADPRSMEEWDKAELLLETYFLTNFEKTWSSA